MGAFLSGKSLNKNVTYSLNRIKSRTRPEPYTYTLPAGSNIGYDYYVGHGDAYHNEWILKITIANVKLFADLTFMEEVNLSITDASLVQLENVYVKYLCHVSGSDETLYTYCVPLSQVTAGLITINKTIVDGIINIAFNFNTSLISSISPGPGNVTQIRFLGFDGIIKYNGYPILVTTNTSASIDDNLDSGNSWKGDNDIVVHKYKSVSVEIEKQKSGSLATGETTSGSLSAETTTIGYFPFYYEPYSMGIDNYIEIKQVLGAETLEYE